MRDSQNSNANTHRDAYVAVPTVARETEPPIAALHRRLRGRYLGVLALGAILGTGFAAGLWTRTKPQWTSTGLVRIEPAVANLVNPESTVAPALFSAWVAEQSTLLQSHPILEEAANDPALIAAGWPTGPEGVSALEGRLEARWRRGENILSVSFTDTERDRARYAVDAVMNAYQRLADPPLYLDHTAQRTALESRRDDLRKLIAQKDQEMITVSAPWGPDVVDRLHARRIEELIAIESRIGGLDETSLTPAPMPAISALEREQARELTRLETRQVELATELDALREDFGPTHPLRMNAEEELEGVTSRIELLQMAANAGGIDPNTGESSADAIAEMHANLYARGLEVQTEIEQLGTRRAALSNLRSEQRELMHRMTAIRERVEDLDATEAAAHSPIVIAAPGDTPFAPVRDRRPALAAAGMAAGFGASAFIFLIGASIAPRLRDEHDLALVKGAENVLAILPDLNHGGPKARAWSTRAIGRLQHAIELDTSDPDSNVSVITSSAAGEGKTSVTMALGSALAASGRKTLLIDADGQGQRLTRELGFNNRAGLSEAFGPDPESARVHATNQHDLWILPIGGGDAAGVTAARLRWLLGTLRTRFDAIIVDTAPVLACPDTPLLAAAADRVVLLVERGRHASTLRACLSRLHAAGARLRGIAFNRATEKSFRDEEAASGSHRSGHKSRGGPAMLIEVKPMQSMHPTPSVTADAIGTTQHAAYQPTHQHPAQHAAHQPDTGQAFTTHSPVAPQDTHGGMPTRNVRSFDR